MSSSSAAASNTSRPASQARYSANFSTAPGAITRFWNALSSYATSSPKKNAPWIKMSPNTLMRSPSASTTRANFSSSTAMPARSTNGRTRATFSASGSACM